MASEVPGITLKAMLDAIIGGDPVKCQAVDNTHGYVSGTSDFMDDISGGAFLGTELNLAVTTTTSGQVTSAGGSLGTISGGDFVEALLIFRDTGSSATDRILTIIDMNSDGSPMLKEGDGGTMTVTFPSGIVFSV
jgi:hypothetical protein